jgi:hypothetical protein
MVMDRANGRAKEGGFEIGNWRKIGKNDFTT